MNLGQASEWAGPHPADVVSDLGQGDRDGTHCAREFHQAVAVGLCLEVVDAFAQFLHASQVDQLGSDLSAEVGRGVQAGTHCSAADGQFAETG